ncbi:glutamate dehydrogenase [Catenovulum agarivorans DS-2]|uniref:Glutamate dehydrogenase n=1 Tax=Catenovulum agarivorans DS-2 TaxID=1328313 RepID=W7R400_9ALTE|nr:NAD-glutamate dehydrogenase [Catenovulum agarivorans]EWH12355.1 glutamate dehydrogenase [Catenovulum agarivorans DS-2]
MSKNKQSVLLDQVEKLIRAKVSPEQVQVVQKFARLIYKDISPDDLLNRNDSDLYGASLSLWHTFSANWQKAPGIRVFNPELSQHGWQSNHTIVEIVATDQPFLVGSLRMALNRLGIAAHWLLYQTIGVKNGKNDEVLDIHSGQIEQKLAKRTVFLIEIDRQSDKARIDTIEKSISDVLTQVNLTVTDWHDMQAKCAEIAKSLADLPDNIDRQQIDEANVFLNWMADGKFTFMGYRQYKLEAVKGDYCLSRLTETSLGLMKNSTGPNIRYLNDVPASAKAQALSHDLMVLTKTNRKSQVHRPAYMDYVGIKIFDKKGQVCGEHRFIGLFSSDFYNDSVFDIPLIKDKVNRVIENSGLTGSSHSYKAIQNILETYPREEILHANEQEISQIALGIMQMQERGISRLFVRKDIYGRYFSCMAFVPRDRYSTQLRKQTQQLLQNYLASDKEVEFNTYLSESSLARTHYMVRVENNNVEIDEHQLQTNMIELTKSWEDKLERSLLSLYGEEKGRALARKYESAFTRSYKDNELPNTALVDIEKLESLSQDNTLEMLLYRPQEDETAKHMVRLKLFHRDKPIHLSDVLPMLENFGLRVIDERPYKVTTLDGHVNWILDFSMTTGEEYELDLGVSRDNFQNAFNNVWFNQLEDDGFNRLVLQAEMTGREVAILRCYAKYMRQIGSSFSQNYIENALASYPELAGMLVDLFHLRFDPASKFSKDDQTALIVRIEQSLEDVANLDDDRIIRRFVDMMLATLRTNYYQQSDNGAKEYISIKLVPAKIPEIPKPVPAYEIFVYSPDVEGVHLRGGKVARGGLRWSDRREDFRTEVLGLVKAQQVKNTVIVPVGAKGGFVCKRNIKPSERAAFFAEGKRCYQIFIRGLLDITDNIQQNEVIPPKSVYRHDDEDPYLVVAADKGTATFSDIANAISQEYGFWLGDAFASGGSVGYDHKKMGITARGAWESVKRHFREIDIDCQTTEFTCVAVGDMAGDVFGNGMLLSEHTKLQAAFNHMHIFIDPKPDAKKSYAERQRLFETVQGWGEYDQSLISKGGGIFLRSAKSIKLSSQMKEMLNTKADSLAPNELIQLILQMQADLFWNGGIGTYIKASKETHADVGDRANDSVRVNGKQVKFKIIGEGGNLGCTQLGRIEAANKGVKVNTDFIDNVGGVDCSDKEVNIKILLNSLVQDGELTLKQRNKLLYDMTEDVAAIVLKDCYRQTHSLSITEYKIKTGLKEQIRFLHALEKEGYLDRELEFLPSDDELAERQAAGHGLTRPELSVLIAYAKMVLKHKLNISEITDNPHISKLLVSYFPKALQTKYKAAMESHPLRSEIIATEITNQIVNDMGMNFVHRMGEETGAPVGEIAVCYTVAREIFGLSDIWAEIERWDNKVSAQVQSDVLYQLRRTIRRTTRWFLRHRNKNIGIEKTIEKYRPVFVELSENLDKYLVDSEQSSLEAAASKLVEAGVDEQFAKKISCISTLFSVMDIAEVVEESERPIELVASVYYKLGAEMDLHWFLEQINKQPVANHWQALARAAYREELDWQQRSITSVVLRGCTEQCTAEGMLESWNEQYADILARWRHMLSDFRATQSHEFAKFSVVLRELMLLSHHCDTMQ